MEVNGKVALLTGGVGGIGKCIARALLENGASVVLFDLNNEKGQEFKQQMEAEHGKGRVHFVSGDVTKKEDLERAFKETLEKFSYLDIMLNNAGIGDEKRWEDMININWVALVRGSNEALKIMSKKAGGKGGVIVNTASIAGLMAYTFGPIYAGTKSAVVGFTRSHGA
ncbi:15-hydroxyprostaglandin dehydrogenase [NAD(+)]-like [Hetaerina americana]|uniref:15-hydroxyprostaglandin dehydrogenase [NAD(+)]-like n=1 Tax=Hetaerina americana TaxID=62018 RepID=UPI003A7F5132